MSIDKATATALRKPFPAEVIGKLPKGGVMLDYVGHAAVTDRLLTVDPEWSWEPMAFDQFGSPMLDKDGNLWIRLTICGMTRIGVGDGKSMKERVGDALRNAAMRFGVALDLWAKENLVEFAQAANAAPAAEPPAPNEVEPERPGGDKPMSAKTRGMMFALFAEVGVPEEQQLAGINAITHKEYESRGALTQADAQAVIAVLEKRKAEAKAGASA